MKRTVILFSVLMIIGVSLFSSCKKNQAVIDAVKNNGLEGNWQLYFLERVNPAPNNDSLELVNAGLMCNLNINSEGEIKVYSADNQNNNVAVWRIVEVNTKGGQTVFNNGITVYLNMHSPTKSKIKYEYFIQQDGINSG